MSKSRKREGEYWKKRFMEMEEAQHKQGLACCADVETQYRRAQRRIEGQIEVWYRRFADNNQISLQEAKKRLVGRELTEFKWDVNDYMKYAKENALDQSWNKQLENASARYHVSRLESLKIQVQQNVEAMFGNNLDVIDKTMRDIYTEGYYRTAFEIQKAAGIGYSFATLDNRLIEKVINKPWAADGKNFSEKIWDNRQKLVNELNQTLVQNMILGQDPQKAIDAIAKKMNTSKVNAGRLVMTEQAYFSSVARGDCYDELGVEQFQIVATLDDRTSAICQEMDGKIFPYTEREVGVTVPPFHPYCRSIDVPYDPDFEETGSRIARGEDDKEYTVPENMTYKEWKEKYVDGDKSESQEDKTSGKSKSQNTPSDDKSELSKNKPDDTIELKDKITDANTQIESLKEQFSDITEGYSYDDWFKDFGSIEEGFGAVTSENESDINKLKDIDDKLKDATQEKQKLLLQKERRGQLDTGYSGRIPDEKLDEYNAKAFEQIKLDTGYSDEEATKFHNTLLEYFGGDYDKILTGNQEKAEIIKTGLDYMPVYDGSIYRGMTFTRGEAQAFSNLKPGDVVPKKGIVSSWSNNSATGIAYGGVSDYYSSSVILECEENQTGAGVQHISMFGKVEAEVLSSADYEVIEVVTESKYDYLSKHKEYLYNPNDLDDVDEMKGEIVCKIKVKEKN